MGKSPFYDQVKAIIEQHKCSTEFLKLTDQFASDRDSIEGLIDLAVSDEEYPYPQYASHLLLHIARKNPGMVEPHYSMVADCVLETENTSVQRNLLGVLICMPVDDYKEGELLDWLFNVLNQADSKPGLINFTVHRLAQYVRLYPELEQEIELTLESRAQQTESYALVKWGKSLLNKRRTLTKRKPPTNRS